MSESKKRVLDKPHYPSEKKMELDYDADEDEKTTSKSSLESRDSDATPKSSLERIGAENELVEYRAPRRVSNSSSKAIAPPLPPASSSSPKKIAPPLPPASSTGQSIYSMDKNKLKRMIEDYLRDKNVTDDDKKIVKYIIQKKKYLDYIKGISKPSPLLKESAYHYLYRTIKQQSLEFYSRSMGKIYSQLDTRTQSFLKDLAEIEGEIYDIAHGNFPDNDDVNSAEQLFREYDKLLHDERFGNMKKMIVRASNIFQHYKGTANSTQTILHDKTLYDENNDTNEFINEDGEFAYFMHNYILTLLYDEFPEYDLIAHHLENAEIDVISESQEEPRKELTEGLYDKFAKLTHLPRENALGRGRHAKRGHRKQKSKKSKKSKGHKKGVHKRLTRKAYKR
jgi:hypothetical protein